MDIILKNGIEFNSINPTETSRNPIGLWQWSVKQNSEQVLTFKELSILSSEIAIMKYSNEEERIKYETDLKKYREEKKKREEALYHDEI